MCWTPGAWCAYQLMPSSRNCSASCLIRTSAFAWKGSRLNQVSPCGMSALARGRAREKRMGEGAEQRADDQRAQPSGEGHGPHQPEADQKETQREQRAHLHAQEHAEHGL